MPSYTEVRPVLLNAIADSAMDAIVAVDDQQRIVLFNPAAEIMFRCPAAEAIGSQLDRFLPKRFHRTHQRDVASFIATGTTSRAMGHLRPLAAMRADGEEFPIEATISQVEVDGRTFGAAIVRDISARQAAETELRMQAEMLDVAYDAIFTWTWDGPISTWNLGAERLYGYSKEEAIGRVSHELLKTVHPIPLDEIRRALDQDGAWEGELIHTRRDGTQILVESRHVLVRDDELPSYILEANRDITRRKQAEQERSAAAAQEAAARIAAEAAAAQRDRLRDILEGLPGGVEILAAPNLRLEFANAGMVELVFGHHFSGTLPTYGRDFVFLRADGTPLPESERPGSRALRGERVHNQQLELKRADGSRLPIVAYTAPLRERGGQITGAIIVVQDMTQIRQAEQLKDDFLALISHEFRTPLTAIHGGAHLLAYDRGSLDAQTRKELLADVVIESERLDRMLTNLLTLANVMAGRLPVATEPVLIGPLARQVAAEVGARSPRHTFVVDISPEVPPAEADPNLLEQVLRNLYENAVKYAPDGGEIRTTAAPEQEMVAIRVTDQGIGIAPEHVASVFERFRRVGSDPTVRGMGLGLYLSRGLVEAQGGRIAASSSGPGKGTTMAVTLPVAVGWAIEER